MSGGNKDKVHAFCSSFVLNVDQIKKLQDAFIIEIKNGLGKLTHDKADVKCHITYVTRLPCGSERGKYLALDLGGTNFRVLLVDLIAEKKFKMDSKIYAIPPQLMTDKGEKLFDHIVDCLADFINVNKLNDIHLPMGFTFSFPLNQVGLQKGMLVRWTKGFNCSGVVDRNVVEMLEDAMRRKGNLKVHCAALLNDTTGTLMSCALENHNCKIGLIVGTGCNGCYLENISEVENWDCSIKDATHVIINCEFGAFGENGCINFMRTEIDTIIDNGSLNKGQQLFEKMVSGMYMGEMVRLIMLELVNQKVLFGGHKSDMLDNYDSFKTAFISEIESEAPGVFTNCKQILKELRLDKHATDEDCENILYICQCISRRSAHMVSAATATLLNKMNETDVTIGVDGSVYRLHPHYHKLMVEKIKELVNPNIHFQVMLSDDGSGKGAAIIAAVTACEK